MNRRRHPAAKKRSRSARLTCTPRSSKILIVKKRISDKLHLATRALCLWGLMLPLGTPASASEYGRSLFQWVDAEGSVRYTPYPEDVPRARRASLQRVTGGPTATWSPGPNAELPAVGAAATGAPSAPPDFGEVAGIPGDLEAAIANLQASIARDQALLANLISNPETAQTLESSSDLAVIAERLPHQQADLEALLERLGR